MNNALVFCNSKSLPQWKKPPPRDAGPLIHSHRVATREYNWALGNTPPLLTRELVKWPGFDSYYFRVAGQARGYELANPTRDRSFWNCAFDLIPSHL